MDIEAVTPTLQGEWIKVSLQSNFYQIHNVCTRET